MSKKIIYFVVCFFIFIFSFNVVTFALGEPSLPGGFFSESHEKIFTLVDHQMGLGGGGNIAAHAYKYVCGSTVYWVYDRNWTMPADSPDKTPVSVGGGFYAPTFYPLKGGSSSTPINEGGQSKVNPDTNSNVGGTQGSIQGGGNPNAVLGEQQITDSWRLELRDSSHTALWQGNVIMNPANVAAIKSGAPLKSVPYPGNSQFKAWTSNDLQGTLATRYYETFSFTEESVTQLGKDFIAWSDFAKTQTKKWRLPFEFKIESYGIDLQKHIAGTLNIPMLLEGGGRGQPSIYNGYHATVFIAPTKYSEYEPLRDYINPLTGEKGANVFDRRYNETLSGYASDALTRKDVSLLNASMLEQIKLAEEVNNQTGDFFSSIGASGRSDFVSWKFDTDGKLVPEGKFGEIKSDMVPSMIWEALFTSISLTSVEIDSILTLQYAPQNPATLSWGTSKEVGKAFSSYFVNSDKEGRQGYTEKLLSAAISRGVVNSGTKAQLGFFIAWFETETNTYNPTGQGVGESTGTTAQTSESWALENRPGQNEWILFEDELEYYYTSFEGSNVSPGVNGQMPSAPAGSHNHFIVKGTVSAHGKDAKCGECSNLISELRASFWFNHKIDNVNEMINYAHVGYHTGLQQTQASQMLKTKAEINSLASQRIDISVGSVVINEGPEQGQVQGYVFGDNAAYTSGYYGRNLCQHFNGFRSTKTDLRTLYPGQYITKTYDKLLQDMADISVQKGQDGIASEVNYYGETVNSPFYLNKYSGQTVGEKTANYKTTAVDQHYGEFLETGVQMSYGGSWGWTGETEKKCGEEYSKQTSCPPGDKGPCCSTTTCKAVLRVTSVDFSPAKATMPFRQFYELGYENVGSEVGPNPVRGTMFQALGVSGDNSKAAYKEGSYNKAVNSELNNSYKDDLGEDEAIKVRARGESIKNNSANGQERHNLYVSYTDKKALTYQENMTLSFGSYADDGTVLDDSVSGSSGDGPPTEGSVDPDDDDDGGDSGDDSDDEDDDYIEDSFIDFEYTYGFDYSNNYNTVPEKGAKVVEYGITGGTNVLYTGDIDFYPYIRMRYVKSGQSQWNDHVLVTSNKKSHVAGSVVVNTALKNPEAYTLHVDSVWDGWVKTINGLQDTKILEKNADDRDVVLHGGSTVFLSTYDTKNVSGSLNIPSSRTKDAHLGVEGFITAVPDQITNEFISYDFTVSSAKQALFDLCDDIKSNLEHYRLEKVMAEGVYRQGEEKAFEDNAKKVDGIGSTGTVHSENDDEYSVVNTFGSFNGTAGNGNGNKLDRKHPKYYLNPPLDDKNHTNAIHVAVNKRVDTFTIDSNIEDEDLKAWLSFRKNSTVQFKVDISTELWKEKHEEPETGNGPFTNTSQVPHKEAVYNKIYTYLQQFDEWDHLNRVTGFVDNYVNSLDFNMGNNKRTRNASSLPGLRPFNTIYPGGGGMGSWQLAGGTTVEPRENWYNEGQEGLSCVRLQADFRLFLEDVRWEVLDPALCGQSVADYDSRNWTDNDNNNRKDTNLTEKGSLKDKVRTFRYQLSQGYSYEGDEDNMSKSAEQHGETGDNGFLGSLYTPRGLELQVFCDDMRHALKSKFCYQDNVTVQQGNK